MNIWDIKKQIKEVRFRLKEAINNGDRRGIRITQERINSLKNQIEKIRRDRKNARRK